MIIPPNYTPIQIIVPDDNQCLTILDIWRTIYFTNQDTYSYISHVSLAKKYNLIYALVKTDKLKEIKFPYTTVPLISAENIEFYKLDKHNELILKEENNIQEIIKVDETQSWYKDGKLHRDNDLPAMITTNGAQFWYKDGQSHRDNDLPAVVHKDGTQFWYRNGKFHRDNDLPAVIYISGTKYWYKNGKQYANTS